MLLRGYEGPVFAESQPSEIFALPSCQGLNLTLGHDHVMWMISGLSGKIY